MSSLFLLNVLLSSVLNNFRPRACRRMPSWSSKWPSGKCHRAPNYVIVVVVVVVVVGVVVVVVVVRRSFRHSFVS